MKMVMKRLVLIMVFCVVGTSLSAASSPEVIWAGGAWRLSDESAPVFLADTFISLGQVDSAYIFSEPAAFLKSGELGMGLGVGARVPVLQGEALAGYNLFLDFTTDNSHKRVTTGVEFFYPTFSAHLNAYLPITDEKRDEEALPGIDLTLGVPIPNASFIILWPGLYYYEGRDEDDLKGLSFAVEVKPVRALSVIVGGRNDALIHGTDDTEVFAELRLTVPLERLGQEIFKFERGQYPANINSMLDDRVVRERYITIEKKRP